MRGGKRHYWMIASVLAFGIAGCCDKDHPLGVVELQGTGPGAVPLATAAGFTVLAGSTVTNTGNTVITGDLGVSPGSAVTGFAGFGAGGPGIVTGAIHAADTPAATAKADLTTAFNDAAGRTTGAVSVSGDLTGLTLAPGLYKSTSSLAVTGAMTLTGLGDANAKFIFQIASTLTTGPGSEIILAGGAQASNIIWQVGTSATLGTNSKFKGTILADQSITLNTGARLDGRALTRIGAVTFDDNAVAP